MSGIDREELLPASPEEVWDELASPERLSEWFGAEVEGIVAPGEELAFTAPDGSERKGVVEVVDPPRRLVFRYLPTERTPGGRERHREASRVVIHIEPTGGQTLIRVTETRVGSAGTPLPQIGFRPSALAAR